MNCGLSIHVKSPPYPLSLALQALKKVRLGDVVLGRELYERPFNYEFYHRLKALIEETGNFRSAKNGRLRVHGEPYKGLRGLRRYPDIIVHVPGTDIYNLLAIEVKVIRPSRRRSSKGTRYYIPYSKVCHGVMKDLLRLYELLEKLDYAYGLSLVVWSGYLKVDWKRIIEKLGKENLIAHSENSKRMRLYVVLARVTKRGTKPIPENGIALINESKLEGMKPNE